MLWKRFLLAGLVVTSGVQANQFASLAFGRQYFDSSLYRGAFSANGFSQYPQYSSAFELRAGYEAFEELMRFSITAFDTINPSYTSGATGFAEVSASRLGLLTQFNLMPAAQEYTVTLGWGMGMGFSRLTLMSDTRNGIAYDQYYYLQPVLGFEWNALPWLNFFLEFSYIKVLGPSSASYAEDIGVTRVFGSDGCALLGLSLSLDAFGSGGG